MSLGAGQLETLLSSLSSEALIVDHVVQLALLAATCSTIQNGRLQSGTAYSVFGETDDVLSFNSYECSLVARVV